MTVAEFFLLPLTKQRQIHRWQQENRRFVETIVGKSPDFFIAIDQGRAMVYPVLPTGEKITER